MDQDIGENLAYAFAAESKAGARNEAFALRAQRDGYPGLSRLFRAVADGKSVHSRRFLLLMRGKIGTTQENLGDALGAEVKIKEEQYLEMIEVAKRGSTAVKKAFIQSMKTDGEYEESFRKASKESLPEGVEYYVCQICGHISEGFVPENCPVCKAVSGRFKKVV